MATNTAKARILLKTGTTSDWTLASNNNFIPLLGEFCIYTDYFTEQQDDGTIIYYPGLKIGDGIRTIGSLPFVEERSISNSDIDTIFANYANS